MASDRLWGNTNNKIVILDSSAILMLFEYSIDLENELTRLLGKYYIVVPRPILDEIEFLSTHGKGKKKNIAKPALNLIKKYEVVEAEENVKGDDAVFYMAQKHRGIVVTNDRALRKRLKDASIRVVFLRAKKKLAIE